MKRLMLEGRAVRTETLGNAQNSEALRFGNHPGCGTKVAVASFFSLPHPPLLTSLEGSGTRLPEPFSKLGYLKYSFKASAWTSFKGMPFSRAILAQSSYSGVEFTTLPSSLETLIAICP